MNILYVSSLCSDDYFNNIFENSKIKPQQQAQKFHSLLSKGLSLIDLTNNLYVLSRPPYRKSNAKTKKFKMNDYSSEINSITYKHLRVINNPIFKHILLFMACFLYTLQWNFKNRKQDRAIICDPLNLSISVAALLVAKIFNVKSLAIVTDIPDFMQHYTMEKKTFLNRVSSNFYTGICEFFLQKYDFYIFLTDQMNDLINTSNRPYVVIEGLVDIDMNNMPNNLEEKYNERIVIYAGALYEKYGVKKLIQAFMRLSDKNVKLWLFGSGEMEEEIRTFEKMDNRIKFFGVVPNEKIVKELVKASILVNPRPSYEEYTKYSFPSKNMEYMVSGTPLLTTPLQGMPSEYLEYVYLFEDESVEGLTKALENTLSKKRKELHDKGMRAKAFVLREKNNQIQASKIMELLSK